MLIKVKVKNVEIFVDFLRRLFKEIVLFMGFFFYLVLDFWYELEFKIGVCLWLDFVVINIY